MRIFKKINSFSLHEKETLKAEFHSLIEAEIANAKLTKNTLAAALSVSRQSIDNCFSMSRDSFNKEVFAEILRKLDKKTSIRKLRQITELYKKVYLDFGNYKLQMMFDQLDNFETGYIKQKPTFAIAKIKFYADVLFGQTEALKKAGF